MTTCEGRRRLLWVARALAAACVVVATLIAPAARAQSEDQAAARVLFDEGRKLLKAGEYAAACPKLEAARKLYSSAGIMLNLADCHEKIGRTASAWTEFGEAATVARRTGRPDDAREATRRQAALEPRLARIVIRVAHPVPDMVVKRDDATLAEPAWGAPLPVDPGAHTVSAEAPGRLPWTTSVTISQPAQVETVDVPELGSPATAAVSPPTLERSEKLEKLGGSPGAPPSVAATPAPPSGRVLPWVLIGGGAAFALGGGALMLVESGRASTARDNHDPAAYDSTKTPWTIGLAGALVGVVAAGAGATLLALPRHDAPAPAVGLSTWIDRRGGGLVAAASW
jgi:hypothetical protein